MWVEDSAGIPKFPHNARMCRWRGRDLLQSHNLGENESRQKRTKCVWVGDSKDT